MKKEWQILQPDIHSVEKLCGILKCHPAVGSILVNRNITSAEDVSNFFNTSLNQLSPPFSIKDMDAAVDRILEAIERKEKILIFGDYDVDGITATTILLEFLRLVDADVSYYIPHRIAEGFGLKKNHISDYALPNRINLVITVDCGSDSHDAVKAANDAKIDVIITDHHMISDTTPPAVAVINPKRNDCPSGFRDLAGVGVAFYLLICLRKKLRDTNFWKDRPEPNLKNYCDLVALGTLADMVPLTRQNRILIKAGMNIIRSSLRPGLNALIEVCRINKHAVDTDDIVFYLAPRLNSAGRMDHASIAVELLTAKNIKAARDIAHSLDRLNQDRRDIENKILAQVHNHLKKNPHLLRKNTLVLIHQDWHIGILGIVASRLMKKYFRPVVLITTANGIGKGSARSIPEVNLYEGLSACAENIENFGGHPMAAGLTIKTENIDPFKNHFENIVSRMTKPIDFIPKIAIDCRLDFVDISDKLIDELESLKPFGSANHEPLFMTKKVHIVSSKRVGNHHRQLVLEQQIGKTGKTFNAIQFNVEPRIPLTDSFDQMAYRLGWNRWNGRKNAQIIIEET
ncbi:MAG: single-stranded-DNA-specific exonuclease RecJ [Deltaproteobacteria bacterium]|nr:single-stranded-DNA-specific exonuclease RecJ [Deltaproteobacteria bacterium]